MAAGKPRGSCDAGRPERRLSFSLITLITLICLILLLGFFKGFREIKADIFADLFPNPLKSKSDQILKISIISVISEKDNLRDNLREKKFRPIFCNYENYRTFVYEDIRTTIIIIHKSLL
ncbi:hypothetical protein QFZ51_005236 [Chitinophaga sp. W3I9]